MKYLAILGRQPEISIAELEALFANVQPISNHLATFNCRNDVDIIFPNINRLGGTMKLAVELEQKPLDYLKTLPEGKITLGFSDYSAKTSLKSVKTEALKLKQILARHGRSVRVVENQNPVLSTATSLHNGLSGKNERKVELIKVEKDWYRVIGVQDIDAYTKRDQNRPKRDAKVGMLPPKLAQILINLCGPLKPGATVLDPFCGTGVVLQEALLMGYTAYGTDLSERMVEYTEKNLEWLTKSKNTQTNLFQVSVGDATSFKWQPPIDAVACECFLGAPMSTVPSEIKLKSEKQNCQTIIIDFLKNLSTQIKPGTPVVIAVPAWLRNDGTYSRLEIFLKKRVDEIANLGYNVMDKSREGLLYHRENQIVARDIIILRKN